MILKVFGIVCIAFCFLCGGFITLMSIISFVDGENHPILVFYGMAGVGLIVAGFFTLRKMAPSRSKGPGHMEIEALEDETW